MKHWTLANKIWLLLGLSCAAGLAAAALGVYQTKSATAAYESVAAHELHDRIAVRELALGFAREVQDWKDTLLRGGIAADLKKYSQAFHEDGVKVRAAGAALRDSASDPQGAKLIGDFLAAHEVLNAGYEKALKVYTASGGRSQQEADRMVRGQDRAVTDPLNQAMELFSQRAAEHIAAATANSARLETLALAGEILVFLALGAMSWLVLRNALGGLRDTASRMAGTSTQVASAARQVAASSQSLAQGSSEQAASLEQISATLEELSAMTRRNGDNSGAANAMMADTAVQVERSNAVLAEMLVSMSAIKASSEKVARINKTIDEIAFQTNILALNAAVEAARAGAAGMGFAVVADEVRTLAQRSAAAARDTAGLIEEAILNSNQGAETLEHVSAAIRGVTGSTAKVKNLIEEVSEASKQQSEGIAQLNTAVAQVSTVTQSAAAAAEQGAAASEELRAQAAGLEHVVGALHTLVEGGDASQSPASSFTAQRSGLRGSAAGQPLRPAAPRSALPRTPEQKLHAPARRDPRKKPAPRPNGSGRSTDPDPFPMDTALVPALVPAHAQFPMDDARPEETGDLPSVESLEAPGNFKSF